MSSRPHCPMNWKVFTGQTACTTADGSSPQPYPVSCTREVAYSVKSATRSDNSGQTARGHLYEAHKAENVVSLDTHRLKSEAWDPVRVSLGR